MFFARLACCSECQTRYPSSSGGSSSRGSSSSGDEFRAKASLDGVRTGSTHRNNGGVDPLSRQAGEPGPGEEDSQGPGAWETVEQKSVVSPQPVVRHQERRGENEVLGPANNGNGKRNDNGGGGGIADKTVLNLAFRETMRLPDVGMSEKMAAWAAGVRRIDLTETGIRTLKGLDAFPNVHTLVLDSNSLVSLPMDCPWCPEMETLWLCNNDIQNLDGLLCQINEVFPRLKSLALMGNPVWSASKLRADTLATSAAGRGAATGGAAGRGGHERGAGEKDEDEKAAYRMHVVRRLPGLTTLDCGDVTEEERRIAKEGRLMELDLMLEAEPTTDVEESLPRDTPPGSTKSAISVTHGAGHSGRRNLLEEDRERRSKLPDRGNLPSTWYKDAVVMDVGSGWARMGLAGRERPSCVFPSIVGRVDMRSYDVITGQDERVYVGQHAIDVANQKAAERELPDRSGPMPAPIALRRPLSLSASGGLVTNWDDMEELWRHGIEEELGLDASEHPVLMADTTATDSSEREKATEVLMETLPTPAVHMALQPVLALYACGPTSGLVVDIGESGTQVVPIYDGFVVENGVRWVGLGGKDITGHLGALVSAKVGLMGGDDFETDSPCDMLKLEALKASCCYVSEDIDKEHAKMELSISKPYTLPDGTRITLGRERYRAAELLFEPGMRLRQEASLQDTILDSILSCSRKTWKTLAQTIILTGGTTELAGLNRRLQKEITRASRDNRIRLKFTVMVPEDDHSNTVWLGGSMLASTGDLDGLWFTRADYEEYGAGYIHSKFAA